MSFEDRLQQHVVAVEKALEESLQYDAEADRMGCRDSRNALNELYGSMRHAVLAGGKRLRPFLVLETAALFGVGYEQALPCATALEMLHSYSLVHDDLPAMDDSDLRRGKPTVHKVWDDATAILAGDGLLTEAFAVLAREETHPDPAVRIELVAALSRGAGALGMVGGQMIDLSDIRSELGLDGITHLQALKTGALIAFSCEAGAILGRATAEERRALRRYADCIGLAFQVVDDLLDGDLSPEEAGKPTGVDDHMGKATFVGLLGRDQARQKAADLVEEAKSSLDLFGAKAQTLRDVADFVLKRRS